MTDYDGKAFIHQKRSDYGEQKYVRASMFLEGLNNDEYLLNETEKIQYRLNPYARKRFNPIPIDETKSYGGLKSNENIVFDSNTSVIYDIDFSDVTNDKYIDVQKTTVIAKSENDNRVYQTPSTVSDTIDRTTRSTSPFLNDNSLTANEFWPICFNPAVPYRLQANWLREDVTGLRKDGKATGIYNTEIPAVCRAQTFKASKTGYIEGVTVNLRASIDMSNTASPLIVQIRPTVSVNNVFYPQQFQYDMLAEERVRFTNTNPGIVTISFKNPAFVQKGKTYAVCFLSPLTHKDNAFWLGGWSRKCGGDPYKDGNAFYSENNGATWIKYGKDNKTVGYTKGRFAPRDFAFEVQIRESKEETVKNKDFWLYLKPIRSNLVKSVRVHSSNNSNRNNCSVAFQVSQNGREWVNVPSSNHTVFFDKNRTGITFVRARMTTLSNVNAFVKDMTVILETEKAKKMYIRTNYYRPRTDPMLGANAWGRLIAPFETVPASTKDVEASVEIISEKIVTETYELVKVADLDRYVFTGLDSDSVVSKSDDERAEYLLKDQDAVESLKEYNVYVLPHKHSKKGLMRFFDYIKLRQEPAYPILDCKLVKVNSNHDEVALREYADFLYNYDENKILYETVTENNVSAEYVVPSNCLCFFNSILNELEASILEIKYNSVLVSNLKQEEVQDGYVLDYSVEKFDITSNVLEERKIKLRCIPLDPIRRVKLLKIESDEVEEELELVEDKDFIVYYEQKTIIFENQVLTEAYDVIQVVYTPAITDNSLCIAYSVERENTDYDCIIKPFSWEYKV